MSDVTFDEVLALVEQLSEDDRARLIAHVQQAPKKGDVEGEAQTQAAEIGTMDQWVESVKKHRMKPGANNDSARAGDAMSVRDVILRVYGRARRYWARVGDAERLALTDADLDEQFWLFDADGIPRLKSEQGMIDIPENSLYRLGEAAEAFGAAFGPGDVVERSREILNTEFADYLVKRLSDDAQ
jgi:hypothetical protein